MLKQFPALNLIIPEAQPQSDCFRKINVILIFIKIINLFYLPNKKLTKGFMTRETILSKESVIRRKNMINMPKRSNRAYCRLKFKGRNMANILLPSSGGTGIRLKIASTQLMITL